MLCVLFSCSEKEKLIYYTYNDTAITRLDKVNEIFLYYGRFENKNSLPQSYIKATYSGFDGGMNCYMIFKENQKVEIVKIDGLFEEIKKNYSLKLIKFNHNIEFIKWSDQIKGNYNNKIRLAETIQYEIKRNKENNSDVKANYPLE